jgi:transcription elongation factor Elf1
VQNNKRGEKKMMKENGQFDIPNNTKVECEFPCPKCGEIVKGTFPLKSEEHTDETAICTKCDEPYDVIITHDAGTGTITVTGVNLNDVKAKGLP